MVTILVPNVTHDSIELVVDPVDVPREAVYAASCAFTDRCYVRLAAQPAGHITVHLQPKDAEGFDGAAMALALKEELVQQTLRQRLADDARDLTTTITVGAFGAPAGAADPGMDDLNSFDDPLAIAQSGEEKRSTESTSDGGAAQGAAS